MYMQIKIILEYNTQIHFLIQMTNLHFNFTKTVSEFETKDNRFIINQKQTLRGFSLPKYQTILIYRTKNEQVPKVPNTNLASTEIE